MNLGPRLRRALQVEASRAETSLNPDDIVRKARRRHRAVVTTSSAAAAVVVVLALVVGLPAVLSQQEPDRGALPPASSSATRDARPSTTSQTRGTAQLRFKVRAENPFEVRGVEGPARIAFFAEIMPVSELPGGPAARVPPPVPGSGYTSVRLREQGGTGVFTAEAELVPGRYVAVIFAGHGVRRTQNGNYPADPVEMISQESDVARDAIVDVTTTRTVSAFYPATGAELGSSEQHPTSTSPDTTESREPRQCGEVAFEAESDAGAFGITAVGTDCGTARDVAAFAEGMVGDPYGTPSGYSCLPERDNSGPTPEVTYTCTRADAKVTFNT